MMTPSKSPLQAVRLFILKIFSWTGVYKFFKYINRNRIAIFVIHGVMDASSESEWIPLRTQLSPKNLDASLKLLKRYYNFIPIDKAVAMIKGDIAVEPNSMVVTFDDGYKNNYKYALPILKKYGIPAAFYLSTGHIEDRKPFWVDRLDYIFQIDRKSKTFKVGDIVVPVDHQNRRTQTKSIKHAIKQIKCSFKTDELMQEAIEDSIKKLETKHQRSLSDIFESDDWSLVMTWDEVNECIKHGITIGSHTIDHVRLDKVSEHVAKKQLIGSRSIIKEKTGVNIDTICYPYGFYNQNAAKIAKECGYKCGLTTVEGLIRKGDDPMTLKRLSFPINKTPMESLFVACGLSLIINKVKNALVKKVPELNKIMTNDKDAYV